MPRLIREASFKVGDHVRIRSKGFMPGRGKPKIDLDTTGVITQLFGNFKTAIVRMDDTDDNRDEFKLTSLTKI